MKKTITVRPGDRVSVPAEDGAAVTGRVEKVEYFTAYNAPCAPDSLKKITRRIHP